MSLEELISEGSKGGSLSTSTDVQFSEVADGMDASESCECWQVGDLDCERRVGSVEDGMSVDGEILYSLKTECFNECKNGFSQVFRILEL